MMNCRSRAVGEFQLMLSLSQGSLTNPSLATRPGPERWLIYGDGTDPRAISQSARAPAMLPVPCTPIRLSK